MMCMNGENSGKIVEASLLTTKVCIQFTYLGTFPLEPSLSPTVAPVVLVGLELLLLHLLHLRHLLLFLLLLLISAFKFFSL